MARQDDAVIHGQRPVAKQLPFEIRSHIGIHLEEQLFNDALILLNNVLNSQTSSNQDGGSGQQAIYIPAPYILTLLATISVHPSTTTRTLEADKQRAARSSLQYLRDVSRTVGPTNADFATAFEFRDRVTYRSLRQEFNGNSEEEEEDEDDEAINLPLANEKSLFVCAEDFWRIVGWALNCACKPSLRRRWEIWKEWLDFMLEAMETDLAERTKRLQSLEPSNKSPVDGHLLQDSLAMQLFTPAAGARIDRSDLRRAMRAIFADGSKTAVAEFGETFRNESEIAKPKVSGHATLPRKRVNLEENEWGDFYDDDDTMEDVQNTNQEEANGKHLRSTRTAAWIAGSKTAQQYNSPFKNTSTDEPLEETFPEGSSALDQFGGAEAMGIRCRLIQLAASLAWYLQEIFSTPIAMFDLVAEFLRPAPVPIFVAFLTTRYASRTSSPAPDVQILLALTLARILLSNSPKHYLYSPLVIEELSKDFLPFAAAGSGVTENAKVAIILELLLRYVWRGCGITDISSVRTAVEQGIHARNDKVAPTARKRKGEDSSARTDALWWLDGAHARMRLLLDIAERSGNTKMN